MKCEAFYLILQLSTGARFVYQLGILYLHLHVDQ